MADIPLNRVIELRQQNLKDNQIIQLLEQEGYMPSDIIEALNQANLKQQLTGRTIEGVVEQEMQPQQQSYEPIEQEAYQEQPMPNGQGELNMPPGTIELLQEISEKIIEEKWQVLYNEVMQIFKWKGKIEAQLAELNTKVNGLSSNITVVQEGIMGKIKDYDSNIQEFGTEIKAMDKVFKSFVPELKETISELDRATKKMKGTK